MTAPVVAPAAPSPQLARAPAPTDDPFASPKPAAVLAPIVAPVIAQSVVTAPAKQQEDPFAAAGSFGASSSSNGFGDDAFSPAPAKVAAPVAAIPALPTPPVIAQKQGEPVASNARRARPSAGSSQIANPAVGSLPSVAGVVAAEAPNPIAAAVQSPAPGMFAIDPLL